MSSPDLPIILPSKTVGKTEPPVMNLIIFKGSNFSLILVLLAEIFSEMEDDIDLPILSSDNNFSTIKSDSDLPPIFLA